jgi:hypothetical protein
MHIHPINSLTFTRLNGPYPQEKIDLHSPDEIGLHSKTINLVDYLYAAPD